MFSCKTLGVWRIVLIGAFVLAGQPSIATVTHWTDMRVEQGHLNVDVEIAGAAGVAIIDAGAQMNGISASSLRNISSRIRNGRSKFGDLLGYDILKHFVLTIDYTRGLVHVALPEKL